MTYLARYAATRRGDKRAVGAAPTGSASALPLSGWASIWVPNRSSRTLAIEGENVNTKLSRSTLNQCGQLARGDRRYPAAVSGIRQGSPPPQVAAGAVMVLVTVGGGC